jgi:hypothetical protein
VIDRPEAQRTGERGVPRFGERRRHRAATSLTIRQRRCQLTGASAAQAKAWRKFADNQHYVNLVRSLTRLAPCAPLAGTSASDRPERPPAGFRFRGAGSGAVTSPFRKVLRQPFGRMPPRSGPSSAHRARLRPVPPAGTSGTEVPSVAAEGTATSAGRGECWDTRVLAPGDSRRSHGTAGRASRETATGAESWPEARPRIPILRRTARSRP